MTADLAARAIRYVPWVCAALVAQAVAWHFRHLDRIEERMGGDDG